jgi:hypothetical protein
MSHRILIIDDEDDIREVAALSLETVAGWEVAMASSGAQGLARAAEYRPDAILLDVMMPGMDGPYLSRTEEESRHGSHSGPPPDRQGAKQRSEAIRRSGCGSSAVQALRSADSPYPDCRHSGMELA